MRPGQLHPNEFERAILERMANDAPWLQEAIPSLHVLSREFTGVGSYTDFVCPKAETKGDQLLGLGPMIRLPGVPKGLGAVLSYQDCQPVCLELFTYGDDHWDGTYEGFLFEEK